MLINIFQVILRIILENSQEIEKLKNLLLSYLFILIFITIYNKYQFFICQKLKSRAMKNMQNQNFRVNYYKDELSREFKQQIEQVYKCSCGKQYKSFPAIYLHFRTKHDIKLSTKPTEKRIHIAQENGVKYILYNADYQPQENQMVYQQHTSELQKTQKNDINEFQSLEIRTIKEVLFKYKQLNNVSQYFPSLQLLEFMKKKHKSNQINKIQAKIDLLPYFLNDFVIQFLPRSEKHLIIGSQQWKTSCIEINKFCKWLRNQRYTDLIVLYQVK